MEISKICSYCYITLFCDYMFTQNCQLLHLKYSLDFYKVHVGLTLVNTYLCYLITWLNDHYLHLQSGC